MLKAWRLCVSCVRLARRRGAFSATNTAVTFLAFLTLVGLYEVMQDLSTLRELQVKGHAIVEDDIIIHTPAVQLDAAELNENFGRVNEVEEPIGHQDDPRKTHRKTHKRRPSHRGLVETLDKDALEAIDQKFKEDPVKRFIIPQGPPVRPAVPGNAPPPPQQTTNTNTNGSAHALLPERFPGNLPAEAQNGVPGNLPKSIDAIKIPASGSVGVPGVEGSDPGREPAPQAEGVVQQNGIPPLAVEGASDEAQVAPVELPIGPADDFHQAGEATRVCTQDERLRHFRDACRRLQLPSGGSRMKNGVIADSLNTIYCHVPQAGDMAWKTVLAVATGRWHQPKLPFVHHKMLEDLGIWQYLTYPPKDWAEALRSYFKFVTVRNPLDRLVTTWKVTMLPKNSVYNRNIGPNIIKRYRAPGSKVDPQFQNAVQFEEFTEFLKDSQLIDRHWRPISRLCNPCGIQWDAILRTETTGYDARIVTDRLPRFNWTLPIFPATDSGINSDLSQYYSKVSQEAMRYLLHLYANDMELYGYQWDAASQVAKCRIKAADGGYCC